MNACAMIARCFDGQQGVGALPPGDDRGLELGDSTTPFTPPTDQGVDGFMRLPLSWAAQALSWDTQAPS